MDRREFEQAQRRAKAAHHRQSHTRLASTLAVYLDRGGAYLHHQQHPGDGSGVPDGHFRICIEVEAPLFWRIYGELAKRKSRRPDRTR